MERRLGGLPELSTRGQTCSITTQRPTWAETGRVQVINQSAHLVSTEGSRSCLQGNGWTLRPSKSSAAKFKSFSSKIQVPQTQMASPGAPAPFLPPSAGSEQVCLGEWAGSLTSKNALAKLLASAASRRLHGPTAHHTHTHTDWLSASHIHLGWRQAQY